MKPKQWHPPARRKPVAYFQKNERTKGHSFIYKARLTINVPREEKLYWNEIVHALNAYEILYNIAQTAEKCLEDAKIEMPNINAFHSLTNALIELKTEHTYMRLLESETRWRPRCGCAEAIDDTDGTP
jgi:hypothetical protein